MLDIYEAAVRCDQCPSEFKNNYFHKECKRRENSAVSGPELKNEDYLQQPLMEAGESNDFGIVPAGQNKVMPVELPDYMLACT